MSVALEVEGLDEAIKHLEEAGENIREEASRELRMVAPEVAAYARLIAPVSTGRYRNSIYCYTDDLRLILGSDDSKAAIIEYGTRPHEIEAVIARALRFFVDGLIVFAKRVSHPGTLPYPVLHNALMFKRFDIIDAIRRGVHNGLQGT